MREIIERPGVKFKSLLGAAGLTRSTEEIAPASCDVGSQLDEALTDDSTGTWPI